MSADKILVLVGGGHTHVQLVTSLSSSKLPSTKRVLISDAHVSYYSGMLPAVVAGLCEEAQAQVHLPSLCEKHGWHFVHGRVTRVDNNGKIVYFRPAQTEQSAECPLPFSVLSLNVGSATRTIGAARNVQESVSPQPLSTVPRAVIYTRPIAQLVPALARFETRWSASVKPPSETDVLVVGAGAAGLELVLALHARFSRTLGAVRITLVSRSASFASQHGHGPGAAALAEMQRHGVTVQLGQNVTSVDATTGCAVLGNGSRIPFHVAVVATGASPHPVLASLGPRLDDDGWLLVEPTLQCVGMDTVFAAGDCASFGGCYGPRYPPKAGVFAVRQGPFLTHNVQVALGVNGLEPPSMKEFVPQTAFLSLLSTGDGRGIGSKYGLTLTGTWVFRLKMFIDEAWQQRFRVDSADSGTDGTDGAWVGFEDDRAFDGTPAQGAAVLLGAEDIQVDDSFETQLLVLKRMDRDEEFREQLISQLSKER